jgi:hypothetical protein
MGCAMVSEGGSGQAVAFTCYTLLIGILGKLRGKGILTQEEIIEMIDLATLLIEEGIGVSAGDPKIVHSLLEQTRAILEGKPHPSDE